MIIIPLQVVKKATNAIEILAMRFIAVFCSGFPRREMEHTVEERCDSGDFFKAITYFLLNKHVTMSVRPLNMLSMILIFNQRLCSFSYPFIPVSKPVHYAALENFISNFVIVVGASNANQRLCTSYSLSTKRLGQVRVKIEGLSLPKYSLIDIIFLFVPYSRCSRHAT